MEEPKRFTSEERQGYVLWLTDLYDQLLRISVEIQKTYGKNSRIGREADLATKTVFTLKNQVADLD